MQLFPKPPWTCQLHNLADHAVPLGVWINRMLWRWSPWHLHYKLDQSQSANFSMRLRAEAAERAARNGGRVSRNQYGEMEWSQW